MLAQVENTLAPDGTRVVIVREPIRKSVKLQVLLDRFDEYIRSDFPGRRESSIECSKSRALKWLSWMKRNRVIEVNAQVVADYANHLAKCGDARSYVDSQWTAVRRYMRWIERQDLLDKNPIDMVRPPFKSIKFDELPRVAFTEENYRKLRTESNGHWVDWVFVLGWNTGMAMIDCCTLRWGEVDMDRCIIKRRRVKTGVEFTVAFDIGGELHEALKLKLERAGGKPDPKEFVDKQIGAMVTAGGDPDAQGVREAANRFFVKAGCPPNQRFHAFRHAFASRMMNSGNDPITVSKITGHKSIDQLASYVHTDERALRAAMDKVTEAYDFDPGDIGERKTPSKLKSSYVWLPNTTYAVKQNKGHKYQDGTPIRYVRTHANACSRFEPVRPCDHNGKDTVEYDVQMDKLDSYWMSVYPG